MAVANPAAGWTAVAELPVARVEHGMVAVESTGGDEDKIYIIGGTENGAAATSVYEYTP
jgi:hypothetical protein